MAQQVNIQNLQTMEVGVNGPNNANRLILITGKAFAGFGVGNNNANGAPISQRQTFTAQVGPVLTEGQFKHAIATAGLANMSYNAFDATQKVSATWTIESVEADWDDESGKVELRFEILVASGGFNSSASASEVSFQVSILAEL